jgi:protein-S-isoprenylcysteine O-methyltransferase Ste14
MGAKSLWREEIGRVAGAVIAVLAVTAASYLWRIPQAYLPQLVPVVYGVSGILMLFAGYIVFRRIVRRVYDRQHRLTPFPLFLQLLIWGMFLAFPYIYNPFDGFVVLWPSGYALGWFFLFAILMHMMILTEEEHLQRIHGEEYVQYCKQVPRYLGFRRGK